MNNNIIIREVVEKDLATLVEIERECIPNPWSLTSFTAEFNASGSLFLAAEIVAPNGENEICGFLTAAVVLDEISVNNVAVKAAFRRNGIAEQLMNTLYNKTADFAAFITLEVRESNTAAIRLYEKLGYKEVGVRKGFYTAPVENARLMTKNIKGNE